MPEDQMFEDLENMLVGAGGKQPSRPVGLARKGSSSRIVPMNDIDDLDDLHQFESKRISKETKTSSKRTNLPPKPVHMGAGRNNIVKAALSDDLDDELDRQNYRREGTLPDTTFNVSPARDFSMENENRRVSLNTREPVQDNNTFAGSGASNNVPSPPQNMDAKKEKVGALDDLADLEDLMEGGESEGNMKEFLAEAFCLVFKDEFTNFSTAMSNAYNNTVQSSVETRKFLQSTDTRALFLKNEILYAVRLAMHLSMDKFVMADFDME